MATLQEGYLLLHLLLSGQARSLSAAEDAADSIRFNFDFLLHSLSPVIIALSLGAEEKHTEVKCSDASFNIFHSDGVECVLPR